MQDSTQESAEWSDPEPTVSLAVGRSGSDNRPDRDTKRADMSASETLPAKPGISLEATPNASVGEADSDRTTCLSGSNLDDESDVCTLAEWQLGLTKPEQHRYQERDEIGRGGWGVVHRAVDRQFGRDVAVKTLNQKTVNKQAVQQRFVHEAMVTGQLQHPGIVPVYELGRETDSEAPFFVMKLLQGQTLAEVIQQHHQAESRDKIVSLRNLLQRFVDVCNAVAYAHDKGIIHRDLKPSNVMVGEFGETVVVDWGLAKRILVNEETSDLDFHECPSEPFESDTANETPGPQNVSHTRMGQVVGTPSYMAPEQARGEIDRLDERSDVYSLGVMLYTILVGRSPFRASDVTTTLEMVKRGDYRKPREMNQAVAKPLAAISTMAMALDSKDRYQSARNLAADVNAWLAGEPVSAYRESLFASVMRWCRKRPVIVSTAFAIVTTLALSASVASVLIGRSHQRERSARIDAVAAQQQAVRSKHLALQNLQESRQAADQWLLELSGNLQFVPGLESLRIKLVDDALAHYQQFADLNSDDPDIWREAVRNQLRVADLLLLSERTEEALQAFRAVENRIAEFHASASHDSRLDMNVEHLNAIIGQVLCTNKTDAMGEWNTLRQLRDDLAVRSSRSAESLDDLEAKGAIGRASLVVARCYVLQQDWQAAAVELGRAQSELEPLVSLRPERFYSLWDTVLREFAEVRTNQGEWDAAVRLYEQRILGLSQRLEEDGQRIDWLEQRAVAKMKCANLQQSWQNWSQAESLYRSATDDLKASWEMMYGSHVQNENLAIAEANLGMIAVANQRADQAVSHLLDAKETYFSAVQQHGATGERLGRMAEITSELAHALSQLGDASADEQYQQAERVFEHLRSEGLQTPGERQRELDMRQQWARYLASQFRTNEAAYQLDQCVKILAVDDALQNSWVVFGLALTRYELQLPTADVSKETIETDVFAKLHHWMLQTESVSERSACLERLTWHVAEGRANVDAATLTALKHSVNGNSFGLDRVRDEALAVLAWRLGEADRLHALVQRLLDHNWEPSARTLGLASLAAKQSENVGQSDLFRERLQRLAERLPQDLGVKFWLGQTLGSGGVER
ncbi:MAG: serine/threonine-protein kinase [Pirellulaceae bacterium]